MPVISRKVVLLAFLLSVYSVEVFADSQGGSNGAEPNARYQKAIAPYIAAAVSTYGNAKKQFLAGLPRKDAFYVSARVSRVTGVYVLAIVKVTKIDESKGLISGRVQNDVGGHTGYRKYDDISIPESEVIDWRIARSDGSDEGDFVGKFIASLDPDTNVAELLADQRDVDLAKIQTSKTVDKALDSTFLKLFDDKDIRLEASPSASPASNVWPSLEKKYRDLGPDALTAELKNRAAAIGKTDKVTVEHSDFQNRDLIMVAAYVVLKKNDVLFEISQYLHFYFNAKGRLDRVAWGLRAGDWILLAPKANLSANPNQ
jgi:hypothetical protein